jgi:chromosome partitioning protein
MIYAVINMKGGVGKTTTAVNLAAALGVSHEKKVLLVDLDPQANATAWIGSEDPPPETIAKALLDKRVVMQSIGKSRAYNVDLAYGSRDIAGVADELRISSQTPGYALRTALKQIPAYDVVLLDCPPGLGVISINAIISANVLIVPIDSQSMALSGVAQIQETIQELVDAEVLAKAPQIRLLLTMYDSRLSLDRAVKDLLEKEGLEVYPRPIRTNTKLAEAYGLRLSIFDYAHSSPGASDYFALADRLIAEENHRVKKGVIPDQDEVSVL